MNFFDKCVCISEMVNYVILSAFILNSLSLFIKGQQSLRFVSNSFASNFNHSFTMTANRKVRLKHFLALQSHLQIVCM